MVAVLEEGGTKVDQGRNAVLNNRRRVEKLPGDKEAAEQAREDGIGSTSCIGGLSSDRPEDWCRAPEAWRGSRQVSISLPNLTSVGGGPVVRSHHEVMGGLRNARRSKARSRNAPLTWEGCWEGPGDAGTRVEERT